MEQIKFSIIVVCLNAGEELGRTVKSVLSQTYDNYEIIVKDGMSTDGSPQRLPEDGRIRLVQQKDKGIYDAMNQAIRLAEGEYQLFLNCGDYLYEEKTLEKINAWIATDKGRNGIYYGDIYNRKTVSRIPSNPVINAFACYRNIPCHQACLYKKEVMQERSYKTEYKVRADYEHFLWCYFRGGVRPVYMKLVVSSYEGGGYSETAESLQRSEEEHRKIVSHYMRRGQILRYRFLLFISLVPLRRRMAESKRLSGVYNRIKGCIYGRRNVS